MSYTVCPPELPRDRECLLGLWQRNLPQASAERFAWLYENGPASGLLLRTDHDEVVGSTGWMQRTLHAFGRVLRAGQAIDLNVDREHRTIGPALGLQRGVTAEAQSGRLDLIYGFPNPQSDAVMRRAGYRLLGDLGRWAKPLSCRTALRHRGWPRGLARAAAAAVDPWLRLRSVDTFYRRPAGIRVETSERFDRRFDDLWWAASQRLAILGERSAEYLDWRFARCPDAQYHTLCLCGDNGRLLAYLVYNCRHQTAYVSDFLTAEPALFEPLLCEFLRAMRQQRVEAVVALYLGAEGVCQTLRRCGFWLRPSRWNTLVYVDPRRGDLPSERLFDCENWHLTRADLDTNE